jgi:NAD(P)-dependent dehydrogenase (short-subunit alcohol dehydrogenase family)
LIPAIAAIEEVADTVSLLVKEKTYIAGAVIAVNGGLL